MNRIVVIKKLEDLKEYCSEKVCMYGEKSEWSNDVKALQIAIGLAKGTTQDVEVRERLKSLEKRVKNVQICISLLAINITIVLIFITFILTRR